MSLQFADHPSAEDDHSFSNSDEDEYGNNNSQGDNYVPLQFA